MGRGVGWCLELRVNTVGHVMALAWPRGWGRLCPVGNVRGVACCPCRGLSGLRRWVGGGSGAGLAGSSLAPLPTASVSPPLKWGELQTLPQDSASRCTQDSPVLPGEESARAGRASASFCGDCGHRDPLSLHGGWWAVPSSGRSS